MAFFISPIFAICGARALSLRVVPEKEARTRSMYFSCQAGKREAQKMVSFFGWRGSKAMALPLSLRFCWDASADVMADVVMRT